MEHRRISRRLIVAAAVTFVVMAAAVAWTWPWLQGWHHPPLTARAEAESALKAAVGGDGVFAEEIALIRQHLDRSYAEDHRQAAAFPWRRDYRQAAVDYRVASAAAANVLAEAARRVGEARQGAQAAVTRSNAVVGETVNLAKGVPFPPAAREKLQRARALDEEARLAFKSGDYASALKAANLAVDKASSARRSGVDGTARFADSTQIAKWKSWVAETIARSSRERGTAIIVNKERREVTVYQSGKRTRTYAADLGRNRLQPKLVAGDGATPEGRYHITSKRARGQTTYYKALMLDYPNADDRRVFVENQRAGRISRRAKIGHLIEIHGNGGRSTDWTSGCVALADHDIDDLFTMVSVGTPVTIIGGDGTGPWSSLHRAQASSEQAAR